jgi:hypothetical protein
MIEIVNMSIYKDNIVGWWVDENKTFPFAKNSGRK